MQVWADSDEAYPVWELSEQKPYDGVRVRLTAAQWRDYQDVMTRYKAWQKKIAAMDTAARQQHEPR